MNTAYQTIIFHPARSFTYSPPQPAPLLWLAFALSLALAGLTCGLAAQAAGLVGSVGVSWIALGPALLATGIVAGMLTQEFERCVQTQLSY